MSLAVAQTSNSTIHPRTFVKPPEEKRKTRITPSVWQTPDSSTVKPMSPNPLTTIGCDNKTLSSNINPTQNSPEREQAKIQTFRGKPINVEPKTKDINELKSNYIIGNGLETAERIKDLNETNGGDKIITGKKYYQPWCADLINYYYEQSTGHNPFGKRLSSVVEIKAWAKKNHVLNNASTPEQIQQQMQNINLGDIIIFDQKYLYKTTNGDIYRNNNVRHVGVVVAIKDGKIVLMEGNTNERQLDKNGNFIVDKDGVVQMKNNSDCIMFKEYDANALFCRGYSGYADMSQYQ